MNRRDIVRLGLSSLAMAALPASALRAQGPYPDRPIRLIVPFAAGGNADLVARLVAEGIGAERARTVLVTMGIAQQTPLNEAFRDILSGELDVALVCGGEAKWRATLAERAGPSAIRDRVPNQDPLALIRDLQCHEN